MCVRVQLSHVQLSQGQTSAAALAEIEALSAQAKEAAAAQVREGCYIIAIF
jgi:hypothetical protein